MPLQLSIFIMNGWMSIRRSWPNINGSENSGTPESSVLIGFSIMNHPFWGTTIFGNTHISMAKPNNSKATCPTQTLANTQRFKAGSAVRCFPAFLGTDSLSVHGHSREGFTKHPKHLRTAHSRPPKRCTSRELIARSTADGGCFQPIWNILEIFPMDQGEDEKILFETRLNHHQNNGNSEVVTLSQTTNPTSHELNAFPC